MLRKYERQQLGQVLSSRGYSANEFILNEKPETSSEFGSATLVNRDTSDSFTILGGAQLYAVEKSIPGLDRSVTEEDLMWEEVLESLSNWSLEVKRESEAIDPWQQEAQDMADDDSYFGIAELPLVEGAIDKSLDELKTRALEHGVTLERIENELHETRKILIKSAQTSTKKEWITLFKSVIIDKLVDWGMQTVLFQTILHTLIVSARDIVQLAEHASRHLP